MPDRYTKAEACLALGITDKTFNRWEAKFNAKHPNGEAGWLVWEGDDIDGRLRLIRSPELQRLADFFHRPVQSIHSGTVMSLQGETKKALHARIAALEAERGAAPASADLAAVERERQALQRKVELLEIQQRQRVPSVSAPRAEEDAERIRILESEIARLRKSLAEQKATERIVFLPPAGKSYNAPPLLPAGSVLATAFGKMHHLATSTIYSQIEKNRLKLAVTTYDSGSSDGRKEYWLTPDQQADCITYWQILHSNYQPCLNCPHTVPTGERNAE